MDVVIFFIKFDDNVRVSIVELAVVSGVLANGLKLLDPVDLNWLLASLLEKCF